MFSSLHLSKREARDVARLAIQSAIAAAAMFSLMEALGMPERFVGVLSAVLVVQPTIGNTLGEASQRFVATLVGCVLGILCLVLLPSGYGTAAALAGSVFVLHIVAGFRQEWRYGVVAAVALALGSDEDLVGTALERSVAIGVGVVVGAMTTLAVWPDRAEVRARRHLRSAVRAVADRLDVVARAAQSNRIGDADEERSRFHREFQRARESLGAVRFADTSRLERKVDAVEKLYNSVLFLNRVTEEARGEPLSDDSLRAGIETVRLHAYALATRWAEEETSESGEDPAAGDRERLRAIREAVAEIREEISSHSMVPELRSLRYALVFSLDEIEDGMSELYDVIHKPA